MKGETVVITGATSGLGEAAALRLAGLGARLVLVARDAGRAQATLARLRAANPASAHSAHIADLSRLSEMRRVAAEIAAAEPAIDVLINNAGAIFARREITEDGLERTFATNHMAYFVLTLALLERLDWRPGARIISTASTAHRGARLDFDELLATQWAGRRYRPFEAYGRSKLANILFTRELSRRLEGSGVSVNCLHPGVVASRFADNVGWIAPLVKTVFRPAFISPEQGADTVVWLASSPAVEGRTGGYYDKRALATPAPAARDDAAAARLWAESEKIAGLGHAEGAGPRRRLQRRAADAAS